MGRRRGSGSFAAMKKKSPPVPEIGTVGWLVFDPRAGREQAGRRPAIVLSHTRYNAKNLSSQVTSDIFRPCFRNQDHLHAPLRRWRSVQIEGPSWLTRRVLPMLITLDRNPRLFRCATATDSCRGETTGRTGSNLPRAFHCPPGSLSGRQAPLVASATMDGSRGF